LPSVLQLIKLDSSRLAEILLGLLTPAGVYLVTRSTLNPARSGREALLEVAVVGSYNFAWFRLATGLRLPQWPVLLPSAVETVSGPSKEFSPRPQAPARKLLWWTGRVLPPRPTPIYATVVTTICLIPFRVSARDWVTRAFVPFPRLDVYPFRSEDRVWGTPLSWSSVCGNPHHENSHESWDASRRTWSSQILPRRFFHPNRINRIPLTFRSASYSHGGDLSLPVQSMSCWCSSIQSTSFDVSEHAGPLKERIPALARTLSSHASNYQEPHQGCFLARMAFRADAYEVFPIQPHRVRVRFGTPYEG